MTTLGYDAYLPLGILVDCELYGSVSTDAGKSDPYFKVAAVKISGQWHQIGGVGQTTLAREILGTIADNAAIDPDIVSAAMREEGWSSRNGTWHPPVDEDAAREFAMGIAAE